ncbi:MAG: glycosyltransferase, partial [Flavobacteriales bacterium]|nr:glycosyltransferase [Flavobacteriales bacterium]
MLSILVPIYNFDCTTLVNSLNGQASKIDVPVEILCIDDNSNLSTQQKNSTLASLEYVDYQVLEENIGRSKIRNLLAEKANHKYLLYLDCDSEIINDDYISKYLDHINENEVIYGGRSYRNEKPKEKKHYLRWHYGRRREFKL